MKRIVLLALCAPLIVSACQKEHPISVYVAKNFQATKAEAPDQLVYDKIAVFPFVSSLLPADDPDGLAPQTMEKFLAPELNQRTDYHLIASNTVLYAIEREGWQSDYDEFLQTYGRGDDTHPEFLKRLAGVLQCDAFLVPVVDTWQKDEVDVQENATPATYVGATLTILDASKSPGTVLFRATDEDYEEGARSERADRTLVRSVSGTVRADPGAKSFAAPPYEDVVPKVIRALVSSLPPR
jgi:hypothetical protein